MSNHYLCDVRKISCSVNMQLFELVDGFLIELVKLITRQDRKVMISQGREGWAVWAYCGLCATLPQDAN